MCIMSSICILSLVVVYAMFHYNTVNLLRHPEAASRPTFFDTLMALQRPDYQLLKWTLEDEAAYSEEARTIGSPIEAGQELYADMQHVYMS